MILLLLLLTAHFIADFYIQPTKWVTCRNEQHVKSKGLWLHFIVHAILYSLVFTLAGASWVSSILAVLVISVSHLLIDLWKSYQKNNLVNFLIDQFLHLVIILIVWGNISGFTVDQLVLFIQTILTPKHMIIAIAYMLVCKPASVVIALALKKHTDRLYDNAKLINKDEIEESNQYSSETHHKDIGLVSAGAWIGYIERCLAISFIFMGQFAAIGFLVATKTIFRFGDLTNSKDMKLTEYMLLGTLLSYAIALFIGWNTFQLYRAF